MTGIYRGTQYSNILALLPNPLTRVDLPEQPDPKADLSSAGDRAVGNPGAKSANRSESTSEPVPRSQ